MTKLAILEEREEDKYEHFTVLRCWSCDAENGVALPALDENRKVIFTLPYLKLFLTLEGQSSNRRSDEVFILGSTIGS